MNIDFLRVDISLIGLNLMFSMNCIQMKNKNII